MSISRLKVSEKVSLFSKEGMVLTEEWFDMVVDGFVCENPVAPITTSTGPPGFPLISSSIDWVPASTGMRRTPLFRNSFFSDTETIPPSQGPQFMETTRQSGRPIASC